MRLNDWACGVGAFLCVLAVSCGNASNANKADAPVASLRGATIYYRQIRCSPRDRKDVTRCTVVEQGNLNRRIYGYAIDSAAELLRIELTPAELTSLEDHFAREHPQNVMAAERMRALLRGVVRIHQGDDVETVQRELAARHNISEEQLSEMTSRFPSVEFAQEALAIDFIGTVDKSARDFFRREMLEPKLRAVIAERASTNGTSLEMAEAQLWREVVTYMQIKIIDDRYDMPTLVGILNRREAHVDVTPNSTLSDS